MRKCCVIAHLAALLSLGLAVGPATAQEPSAAAPVAEAAAYNSGDLAWMMVSTALVLLMTGPGLALFYGGLVRKKNILSVMMQCLFLMGLNSVLWDGDWL